jgi:predicted DNA binding CopG/RHH family protein
MKPIYAKSRKEYEKDSEFPKKELISAAKRLKNRRKQPTSVALEQETVRELKSIAQTQGVPYQVLMRMFILDGLRKFHSR